MPELDIRSTGNIIQDHSRIPEALSPVIDMEGWARAIVRGTKYKEPDPGYISRTLALQIIGAETVEDIYRQTEIRRIQDWIPDTPGATSGPLELIDLYVSASDFETGNPTFIIATFIDLELGEEFKATTGATNIQATLIALIVNGVWPIRVQIKRGEVKDKGGRYLLFMLPPD